MTPAPTESAKLINTLRQQLILAQVRIMELEDERDQLSPRILELNSLLSEAQNLADAKLDETAHLQKVLADTQSHVTALQHQLTQSTAAITALRKQLDQSEQSVSDLNGRLNQTVTRNEQLQQEIKICHSSLSWRWTSWLRFLEGLFKRNRK